MRDWRILKHPAGNEYSDTGQSSHYLLVSDRAAGGPGLHRLHQPRRTKLLINRQAAVTAVTALLLPVFMSPLVLVDIRHVSSWEMCSTTEERINNDRQKLLFWNNPA